MDRLEKIEECVEHSKWWEILEADDLRWLIEEVKGLRELLREAPVHLDRDFNWEDADDYERRIKEALGE